MGRISWDEYFLRFAACAASKSKDSTRVGCVIVGPDREIRSTGFNGPPTGVQDLPERFERPAKYLWVSHAENGAICHAARVGVPLKGCTLYCTHTPCSGCAKAIIQAGITQVVTGPGTTSMPPSEFEVASTMLTEAGVTLRAVKPDLEDVLHLLDIVLKEYGTHLDSPLVVRIKARIAQG